VHVKLGRAALLIFLALGVLLVPLAAEAQQTAGELPRVGVLVFTPMAKAVQDGFRQGFRDHGYIEGQNILVEWRSAAGSTDHANAMAAELVRLKVNVIVAEFTPAVQAVKNATRTIPIVMASAGDPVSTGLVASLARPGGNVTGLSNVAAELSGKRFELLRELLPGVTRGAVDPWSRPLGQSLRRWDADGGFERWHPASHRDRAAIRGSRSRTFRDDEGPGRRRDRAS
jgi:putative ABC transport system substrate-binding protein